MHWADPSLDIDIPPADWETSDEDWEPPSIRLHSNDLNFDYRAGGSAVAMITFVGKGDSQVDSFTTDGYHASGTATFVDIRMGRQSAKPVSGTFEATCPRPKGR